MHSFLVAALGVGKGGEIMGCKMAFGGCWRLGLRDGGDLLLEEEGAPMSQLAVWR